MFDKGKSVRNIKITVLYMLTIIQMSNDKLICGNYVFMKIKFTHN